LTHPLPAALETEIIGFDLTMIEDWFDGACFDANDVKLLEQYKANSTIVMVKGQIRYGFLDKAWQSWKAFSHSFWFQNTFRSLAISIGTEIKRLNRKVGSGYFKAEHFLWIHPALDRTVEQKFGSDVLQELIHRRKRLVWKIFSHRYERAVELLRRIYRPKIKLAIDLRRRFDIEYLLGELEGQSYLRDLERLSFSQQHIERARKRAAQARESDSLLARFLSEEPESSSKVNALQRRALRIATHLNLSHLRDSLTEYYSLPTSAEGDRERSLRRETVRRIIPRTAANDPRFSHSLVAVRTFWLLNWLELDEYCRHLKEIAYPD